MPKPRQTIGSYSTEDVLDLVRFVTSRDPYRVDSITRAIVTLLREDGIKQADAYKCYLKVVKEAKQQLDRRGAKVSAESVKEAAKEIASSAIGKYSL